MFKRAFTMSLRRSVRVSSRPGATVTISNTITITHDESPSTSAGKVSNGAPKSSRKRASSSGQAEAPVKKTKKAPASKKTATDADFKKPEVPVTPLKNRRATNLATKSGKGAIPKTPPSLTPTPSLVSIIRASYSTGDIDDATPPPVDRPVDPHITNAPLVTPGGTRTVAYDSRTKTSSTDHILDSDLSTTPSKNRASTTQVTTGTLLEKACAHLISVDARFKPLIAQHRCAVFAPEGLAEVIDPFRSLSSGIMGQQVSGAAAKSIKNKFIALFNKDAADGEKVVAFPTPAQVAVTPIERLRLAGLSQRKAEYIQGLAEKFINKELTNEMLLKASDEEVMERLIAVRGLGKWSVEMFACFGLKRMDILSTGDLGVQRGMAHFFGKDVQKLKAKGGGKWKYMSEQDMLDKSAPFAPYRSLFMWYMWRVEDVDVDVMQSA